MDVANIDVVNQFKSPINNYLITSLKLYPINGLVSSELTAIANWFTTPKPQLMAWLANSLSQGSTQTLQNGSHGDSQYLLLGVIFSIWESLGVMTIWYFLVKIKKQEFCKDFIVLCYIVIYAISKNTVIFPLLNSAITNSSKPVVIYNKNRSLTFCTICTEPRHAPSHTVMWLDPSATSVTFNILYYYKALLRPFQLCKVLSSTRKEDVLKL